MPNLRATVLLKCLFPMSGEVGPFSAAKKSVPLQFPWPQLYSLFFFSSNTLLLLNFLFSFFLGGDEGVSSGGGGGAVSFSRVYQAQESGSVSDFTRGKSKPSAAVDSGEVESAY